MYGFSQCAPYSLYLTNWTDVWVDAPPLDALYARARRAGMPDFDAAKLRYLTRQLAAKLAGPVRFTFAGTNALLDLPVTPQLTWLFALAPASPAEAARVFRNLALQSFANHSLLQAKVRLLENMVRARDTYTLYLEENYKTINGTELMDKYRRQHRDEARFLDKYVRDETDAEVRR